MSRLEGLVACGLLVALPAAPDLGDGAYGFLDSGDGRYKLRVLRRGDVTLEATASTAARARALAEAAFKALAKEP